MKIIVQARVQLDGSQRELQNKSASEDHQHQASNSNRNHSGSQAAEERKEPPAGEGEQDPVRLAMRELLNAEAFMARRRRLSVDSLGGFELDVQDPYDDFAPAEQEGDQDLFAQESDGECWAGMDHPGEESDGSDFDYDPELMSEAP